MKYSLRSLMIVVAVGPPLLAFLAIEIWREFHWYNGPNLLSLVVLLGIPIAIYRVLAGFRKPAP
jgi:hypothetical protein